MKLLRRSETLMHFSGIYWAILELAEKLSFDLLIRNAHESSFVGGRL